MTGLLDLSAPAWETYQSLRADGGELAERVKQGLEWLVEDPAAVRAHSGSQRYQIIERWLGEGPQVWSLPVAGPEGDSWIIVWRQMSQVVEVGYIGRAPVPSSA